MFEVYISFMLSSAHHAWAFPQSYTSTNLGPRMVPSSVRSNCSSFILYTRYLLLAPLSHTFLHSLSMLDKSCCACFISSDSNRMSSAKSRTSLGVDKIFWSYCEPQFFLFTIQCLPQYIVQYYDKEKRPQGVFLQHNNVEEYNLDVQKGSQPTEEVLKGHSQYEDDEEHAETINTTIPGDN